MKNNTDRYGRSIVRPHFCYVTCYVLYLSFQLNPDGSYNKSGMEESLKKYWPEWPLDIVEKINNKCYGEGETERFVWFFFRTRKRWPRSDPERQKRKRALRWHSEFKIIAFYRALPPPPPTSSCLRKIVSAENMATKKGFRSRLSFKIRENNSDDAPRIITENFI